ncbi:hypothetical protein PAXINDRAFT_18418 [Paxillus involutus ATCC 200175]|uniref:Uncharacterized protein n=1 Tax=Paxillus involutus ATCC 200175 TaxID=664439 RepID=A0A0C9TMA5_PAXIN|nr:hypothetical protein PAXINDRAFT_18418 [Paxillus involutus ATCC 200175]
MQGLPHYHGVNLKSYALDGAVPDVYLFLAVPSTQNQSGVESSAITQDAKLGQGVAGTLETTHHDCQTQFACGWLSESDQSVCGKLICCKTAPDHFKVHGIFKKNKKDEIPCNWEGCRIKRRRMPFISGDSLHTKCRRNNFIRHIRESHLGHARKS